MALLSFAWPSRQDGNTTKAFDTVNHELILTVIKPYGSEKWQ
jgi:hypothetical protein